MILQKLSFSVLFLLSVFALNIGFAQENLINRLYKNKLEATAKIQYFHDVSGNYTLQQIQSILVETWQSIPQGSNLNLGYFDEVVWLKLDVQNTTPESNNWILHLTYTLLDTVDIYLPNPDGTYQLTRTGRNLPFHTRGEIKSPDYAFALNLPDSKKQTVFARIHTKGPLSAPIKLQQQAVFKEKLMNDHIYYGFYAGALCIMFFYNLFVFVTLRDKNYLYYILSILCTVGIFMTVAGYSFKYIFPESVWLNTYFTRIFMGLVVLATGAFALNFLEVKKYILWGDYLLKGIMMASAMAIVLVITDVKPSATNSIVSIHTIILLTIGFVVWKKGNPYARYYVMAWMFYLIGGVLITLRNSGILPINIFTTHGAEIGSMLEVILLSLALSDKYRIMKKEKEALQEKNLHIQQKYNEELEQKVQERTIKLCETNEELNQLNEELQTTLETVQFQKLKITKQNDDIKEQSKQLEEAFNSIRSSINYAKRIQEAKLPQLDHIKEAFPESFVFFRPLDQVSGDFYWFAEIEGKKLIAAIDCTGHGVPGAFMSMIGSQLLNEVVKQRKILQPNEILNQLHAGIRQTLRQRETANRDGMDMSLCVWDSHTNTLQFAGAKNPIICISRGEMQEIKGDRMPIGGLQREEERLFTLHEVKIDTPTHIYIYSDGFQDQFGGKEGRKFLSRRFKELLYENHQLPMEDQQQLLTHTFENWLTKNPLQTEPQIDDVLVIGFKLQPEESKVLKHI